MTEQNPSRVLERLWDEIPAGPAPVEDMIRRGRAVKRLRRVAALGSTLAVVVVGTVVVHAVMTGDPGPPVAVATSQVDLPTSGWTPRDPSMTALSRGRLAVDDRGCVYLAAPEPAAVELDDLIGTGGATATEPRSGQYWVWPAGFTATRTSDGILTLYDPQGRAIAHGGDVVEAGGGSDYVTRETQHPCLPDVGTREVFYVQSSVWTPGQ